MSTIRASVPGSELTTLQVGGVCREVIDASGEADLLDTLASRPTAICVGGGSNLVIADAGFDGTVIRAFTPQSGTPELQPGAGVVRVDATIVWDDLVRFTIAHGLAGLEATSGVPGSVGGAVVQNLGAYGQETADVLVSVEAWDTTTKARVTLTKEQCEFSYRSSRFKHDEGRRFVVTSVLLHLMPTATNMPRYGDVSELLAECHGHSGPFPLEEIRAAVLDVRRSKGMLLGASAPSAGSFFTNPILNDDQATALAARGFRVNERADGARLTSAAALLEGAGFQRGFRKGSVGLSEHHVLALVNLGGATASDVVGLAVEIRNAVDAAFGVRLKPEPVLLGFDDNPFS